MVSFAWEKRRAFAISWLLVAFLLVSTSLLARDKTDVLILKNGDRVTGEIKSLERGRLQLSTDSMGTVSIEWNDIVQLTSLFVFEVENEAGFRYVGTLRSTPDGEQLEVRGDTTTSLRQAAVIRLTPVEDTFWQRWKGSADVGFDFTSANSLTQWSLGTRFDYLAPSYTSRIAATSTFSGQDDVESTSRNTLDVTVSRLFGRRWMAGWLMNLQQSEELSLDIRSMFGGGLGRRVLQSNHLNLTLLGGVAFTRESFAGTEAGGNNAEALAALRFDAFRFDDPEMDISSNFLVLPSLTEAGRVRVELDARVRFELVSDLFWSINVFNSFDSQPPEEFKRNNFGIFASLGWTF